MKIMTQKQGFIKRAFTHNRREKLLSVLCTVVVMLVAVCFKPVHKVYSFRVDTKIAPDQVIVSGNIDKVEIKVIGTFFELRKVNREDLVISFDFSSEKAGEISRNIGESTLPASFTNLATENIFPETITLQTEMKKEKTLPVKVVFEGETEINLDGYKIVPNEVRIVGAESAVEKLEVMFTEQVSAETLASSEETEISIIFPEFTVSADGVAKVKIAKKGEGTAEEAAPAKEENAEKTANEEKNE